MATDFGLRVARYSTSTPSVTTDDSHRELRIDGGGRLYTRLADGNDNPLDYFADGDAVGSGSETEDRGIVILGLNDTDSNYQILKVNDDGALIVSSQGGTDVSISSDETGDGEEALTVGTWVLINTIAVATGTLHINGWTYGSDKNTQFLIAMSDDTLTDGHDFTDITEILDMQITSSARPSDNVGFIRALDRAGGTNVALTMWAKQLQPGATGVGFGMMNAYTTT